VLSATDRQTSKVLLILVVVVVVVVMGCEWEGRPVPYRE
jgi:hypothetical protein